MNRRRFLSSALKTASAASCAHLFVPSLHGAPFASRSPQNTPSKLSGNSSRPQIALTMDDPKLTLGPNIKWPEANARILKALAVRNIKAALFVCGMRVDEPDGTKLLTTWDQAGHLICNHTYSHLSYMERTSYQDFAFDFLKNEKVIAPFRHRTFLFRYPSLKEGDTAEKRDQFRALLKERGYHNGHVTIDASDWYVDQRMNDRLYKQANASLTPYRDYLIAHLLDRASFYRQLAIDVVGREIRHTILMHYNTLNALFLPEVMNAFENIGWQWVDADHVYDDPVFKSTPKTVPAGESLVWALASETGRFKEQLRWPGEDGDYEKPKMDALNL